jgi:hypothetical protein
MDIGESMTFSLHEADDDGIDFLGINIGTKAPKSSYTYDALRVDGTHQTGSITNLAKDGTIVIMSNNGVLLESVTITKTSGSATKIGIGDIDIILPPPDVVLNFAVRLTDGDNDYADQSFTVSIDGNNDGSITSPLSSLTAFDGGSSLAAMSIDSGDSFASLRQDSHQDLFLM